MRSPAISVRVTGATLTSLSPQTGLGSRFVLQGMGEGGQVASEENISESGWIYPPSLPPPPFLHTHVCESKASATPRKRWESFMSVHGRVNAQRRTESAAGACMQRGRLGLNKVNKPRLEIVIPSAGGGLQRDALTFPARDNLRAPAQRCRMIRSAAL